MSGPQLSIQNVSRSFADIDAVRDVSLDVAPGECVALIGHNGAGKTTLFKLILGLLQPDSGHIQIAGANHMRPGFLPEAVAFQRALSAREVLAFFAKLKGCPGEDINALLDKVQLGDDADRRVGTFSKGMRQKLGLAQALIGSPSLLILDEPTTGLDPTARRAFYTLLDDLCAHGISVLLSSHALAEVEGHASSIAMMKSGRLVARGTLVELAAAAKLPFRTNEMAAHPSLSDLYDHFQNGGSAL